MKLSCEKKNAQYEKSFVLNGHQIFATSIFCVDFLTAKKKCLNLDVTKI